MRVRYLLKGNRLVFDSLILKNVQKMECRLRISICMSLGRFSCRSANQLRKEVEEKLFTGEELSQPIEGLTISIGVSSFPDDVEGIEQVIDAADRSLYVAKQ